MWTWASYTVFAARFDNNDVIHWFMTFVIMFAGAIMAIQIPTALEDGANGFAVGFLISQISVLFTLLKNVFRQCFSKIHDSFLFHWIWTGRNLLGHFIIFLPAVKFIFWALGMSVYLLTPWMGRKRVLSKVPLHTMYIPERFGSFTIIILGQIIASVVFGLESASWHPSSFIISMLAFILAILIWGQYYRLTQIADYKCILGSGQPYIYSHIPLIISLIMIGVCAQEFISHTLSQNVKFIFCFSVILYLISFYILQNIAILEFKIRGLFYAGGIIAILGLFFLYPFSPLFIMSGVVIIFAALFAVQYRLDQKI